VKKSWYTKGAVNRKCLGTTGVSKVITVQQWSGERFTHPIQTIYVERLKLWLSFLPLRRDPRQSRHAVCRQPFRCNGPVERTLLLWTQCIITIKFYSSYYHYYIFYFLNYSFVHLFNDTTNSSDYIASLIITRHILQDDLWPTKKVSSYETRVIIVQNIGYYKIIHRNCTPEGWTLPGNGQTSSWGRRRY
jgi:hypothetical protein